MKQPFGAPHSKKQYKPVCRKNRKTKQARDDVINPYETHLLAWLRDWFQMSVWLKPV